MKIDPKIKAKLNAVLKAETSETPTTEKAEKKGKKKKCKS